MSAVVKFSQNDFLQYSKYLSEEIGFHLKAEKITLLEGRLQKRLAEKKLTPSRYLKLVQEEEEEKKIFIDVITTHKTDWFREDVHFDFIRDYVSDKHDKKLFFWSAASSTGEEAYSLGIILREAGLNKENINILGTDVSLGCVKHCLDGKYKKSQITGHVPPHLVQKYFLKSSLIEHNSILRIKSTNIGNYKFREFNLVSDSLPSNMRFDVIMLRNVMIYFDQMTIGLVVTRLLRYLRPGGYLIVGLSETIQNSDELGLKRINNSIYIYE